MNWFIALWGRLRERRKISKLVNQYFDPSGGKIQVGRVDYLDLSGLVPSQIIELSFDYRLGRFANQKWPKELPVEPAMILEVLSPADADSPAIFKILKFCLEDGYGFKDVFGTGRIPYPPNGVSCSILESGILGLTTGGAELTSLVGGKNFLKVPKHFIMNFNGENELEFMPHSALEYIHISEPRKGKGETKSPLVLQV